MVHQCDQCRAQLWRVDCEPCGGTGSESEGEHAEECDNCAGEGYWYECPMAAGGECGNDSKIDPTSVE
jgi:hypothetical protein